MISESVSELEFVFEIEGHKKTYCIPSPILRIEHRIFLLVFDEDYL